MTIGPCRQASGFCLEFEVFETTAVSVSQFLATRLVAADVERLAGLFDTGLIRLNGHTCLPDTCCYRGDLLCVSLPWHCEAQVDTAWQMLWQNTDLMALYKPHNLPVSRTTRNLYNTLISLVKRQTPYADARLLHRLDSETAGVILLAKHQQADKFWKPRLDQLIQRKIYHAWVYGEPDWKARQVNCVLAEKYVSEIRSQVYVVDGDAPAGTYKPPRLAKTGFKVLRSDGGRSLIECQLFSGRKHQIRATLAALGHPIVGDKVYAFEGRYYLKRIESGLSAADLVALGSPYHRLIAHSLSLLPGDEQIEVVAPDPPLSD